ncbi:hypothetical protein [Fodinicola feengrottensis]|uniref:hypothetical protein n=1 Tax=Fodinicola feengrottensis TaxID=435914 RepID=UPI002441D35C|nr:hypothetical protein [Fodinicola feengrottensis]
MGAAVSRNIDVPSRFPVLLYDQFFALWTGVGADDAVRGSARIHDDAAIAHHHPRVPRLSARLGLGFR